MAEIKARDMLLVILWSYGLYMLMHMFQLSVLRFGHNSPDGEERREAIRGGKSPCSER